jgi:hypothetical protein
MYAHYTGTTKLNRSVLITSSNRPIGGTRYNVSGKAEARRIAKANNAVAWNF